MKKYIEFLMRFHHVKQSFSYKLGSLFCGAIIFLLLLPVALVWIGIQIDEIYSVKGNLYIRYGIAVIAICKGLFFMLWATYTQWVSGKGTPAPNAPTQKLVISGPYRLTRNPIELGAIFYYFGIGTFFYSYTVGVVCFVLGLIVGSTYHKFFEEQELKQRFGDAYKQYRQEVPFLFPVPSKFWLKPYKNL